MQKKPFFSADLELISFNKYGARYRVLNHEGAECSISHFLFGRDALPEDDNFNLDFIRSELPKGSDKKTIEKQKHFRSFMNFKMVIS